MAGEEIFGTLKIIAGGRGKRSDTLHCKLRGGNSDATFSNVQACRLRIWGGKQLGNVLRGSRKASTIGKVSSTTDRSKSWDIECGE